MSQTFKINFLVTINITLLTEKSAYEIDPTQSSPEAFTVEYLRIPAFWDMSLHRWASDSPYSKNTNCLHFTRVMSSEKN